ncbi:hypothetical protein GAO09_07055 [Rhizobiales bacterium RZME27]|uniref:Uncharacterized protein n=1 Tax=Endobacterium cereale TaxID=2663029 RepID=A0A6A8A973_9HYPH|nr:hypothetical protein [Endobacterium cereale]MQY45816.1 hypothetical protein [Endobacterium cereale]
MKKPQRSFVVEYKSGRRKLDSKAPSSIWGNLDLKSVARDVEVVLVQSEPSKPGETSAPAHVPEQSAPTSASIDMVDIAGLEVSIDDVSAAPDRADEQDIGAAVPAIRRRKSGRAVRERRSPAGRRLPQDRRQTPVEHNEPDDLEQLEVENRLLRTMLAAKLRKENSWLRERLQHR